MYHIIFIYLLLAQDTLFSYERQINGLNANINQPQVNSTTNDMKPWRARSDYIKGL